MNNSTPYLEVIYSGKPYIKIYEEDHIQYLFLDKIETFEVAIYDYNLYRLGIRFISSYYYLILNKSSLDKILDRLLGTVPSDLTIYNEDNEDNEEEEEEREEEASEPTLDNYVVTFHSVDDNHNLIRHKYNITQSMLDMYKSHQYDKLSLLLEKLPNYSKDYTIGMVFNID